VLDKLFEKWLDDVFVMLMSKSKKEVARLAYRAGYHACEAAQQKDAPDEAKCPHCLGIKQTHSDVCPNNPANIASRVI